MAVYAGDSEVGKVEGEMNALFYFYDAAARLCFTTKKTETAKRCALRAMELAKIEEVEISKETMSVLKRIAEYVP